MQSRWSEAFTGPELPIAKTAYIGHGSDSKGAVIGRYYCI